MVTLPSASPSVDKEMLLVNWACYVPSGLGLISSPTYFLRLCLLWRGEFVFGSMKKVGLRMWTGLSRLTSDWCYEVFLLAWLAVSGRRISGTLGQ